MSNVHLVQATRRPRAFGDRPLWRTNGRRQAADCLATKWHWLQVDYLLVGIGLYCDTNEICVSFQLDPLIGRDRLLLRALDRSRTVGHLIFAAHHVRIHYFLQQWRTWHLCWCSSSWRWWGKTFAPNLFINRHLKLIHSISICHQCGKCTGMFTQQQRNTRSAG